MTPKKAIGWLVAALVIVFIASGDTFTFLPKEARDASRSSRNFLAGLWPEWLKPKDMNAEREKEIEQINKGQSPNSNP